MQPSLPRFPLDQPSHIELSQSRLNIEERARTSRLPWRGQFSPELIEYLIESIFSESSCLLDPFCGSGTVLFEALEQGKKAVGAEINPAAWHLASLASFASLTKDEKIYIISELKKLISQVNDVSKSPYFLVDKIANSSLHPFLRKVFAASIFLGMGNKDELTISGIRRGAELVLNLLRNLYPYFHEVTCLLNDARHIAIADETIDAIITSPPYINVFNYHQNYRKAAELLGWKPLEAAASEIGANRKYRQNRFLTVIQYCMDMILSLDEMSRILKRGSILTLVLGRTSSVLGAAFENSAIITELLTCTNNFKVLQLAERAFTNRFGEEIREDIIIASCLDNKKANIDDAREIGIQALMRARLTVPEKNRFFLSEAVEKAYTVTPSPLLDLSIPVAFVG